MFRSYQVNVRVKRETCIFGWLYTNLGGSLLETAIHDTVCLYLEVSFSSCQLILADHFATILEKEKPAFLLIHLFCEFFFENLPHLTDFLKIN